MYFNNSDLIEKYRNLILFLIEESEKYSHTKLSTMLSLMLLEVLMKNKNSIPINK